MIRLYTPRLICLATLAGLLLTTASASANGPEKLDKALRESRRTGRTERVIVTARPGYRPWLRQQLTQQGKKVEAEYPSIDALVVELTAADLDQFCGQGASERCALDAEVSPSASANGNRTGAGSPSHVNSLLGTLGLAPYEKAGNGVTVAVIDSGLHPSDAFRGRIKAFYDFTGGTVKARKPFDDYGHGTHVAGLIGGLEIADAEFSGVAPGVQFVGLKVLDAGGRGRTSDVIRAIEFAIANRNLFGIGVINLSLGHPIYEPAAHDPLVLAVEKAVSAGIIVVASAGNHGVDDQLPVLAGMRVNLRELRLDDAPALLALLTTEEVSRFISPPPTSVEGFERFIEWAHQERAAGQYACKAVWGADIAH